MSCVAFALLNCRIDVLVHDLFEAYERQCKLLETCHKMRIRHNSLRQQLYLVVRNLLLCFLYETSKERPTWGDFHDYVCSTLSIYIYLRDLTSLSAS